MKVNTNVKIKKLDGEIFLDAEGKDATVKAIIINALSSPMQEDNGELKFKKYGLAKKIYESDNVELVSEDITLIKEVVGKLYAPLVVGFVWDVLEGKICNVVKG